MQSMSAERVAIFWDFENCRTFAGQSGRSVVNKIRHTAHSYGQIILFKAYAEMELSKPYVRSDLQLSGVSLVDCPHNGKKEVADKMMTVDIMTHVMDNPAPGTIILITGDRDFAYLVAIVRMRRYRVVTIVPPNHHSSLQQQASVVLDWNSDILLRNDGMDIPSHCPSVPTQSTTSPPENDSPMSSEATFYFGRRCNRALQHLLTGPESETHQLERFTEDAASASDMFKASTTIPSHGSSNTDSVASIDSELQPTLASPENAELRLSKNPPTEAAPFPPVLNRALSQSTDVPMRPSTPIDQSNVGTQRSLDYEAASIIQSANSTPDFGPLIAVLTAHQINGENRPRRAIVAADLKKADLSLYLRFAEYIASASHANIIVCGGPSGPAGWISLFYLGHPLPPDNPQPSAIISSSVATATENVLHNTRSERRNDAAFTNDCCSSPTMIESGLAGVNTGVPLSISPVFIPLVNLIREQADKSAQVPMSKIGEVLLERDPSVYQKAGVTKLRKYIRLAVAAGFVIKGGEADQAWVSLHPSIRLTDMVTPADIASPSASYVHSNSDRSRTVPHKFVSLVNVLRHLGGSAAQFLRETVRVTLLQHDPQAITAVGVQKFRAYLRLAVAANVVTLTGSGDEMQISLHPRLHAA